MPDRRYRPIQHGTTGGYQRCRHLPGGACTACRKAWREYFKARYQQKNNSSGVDIVRMRALENLAARHPSEFLDLYRKANEQFVSEIPSREEQSA